MSFMLSIPQVSLGNVWWIFFGWWLLGVGAYCDVLTGYGMPHNGDVAMAHKTKTLWLLSAFEIRGEEEEDSHSAVAATFR